MGIKLGWRVLILFILTYIILWGILGLMTFDLALIIPLFYWYLESKFQRKQNSY